MLSKLILLFVLAFKPASLSESNFEAAVAKALQSFLPNHCDIALWRSKNDDFREMKRSKVFETNPRSYVDTDTTILVTILLILCHVIFLRFI